jgi:hypothetical protein
MKINSTQLCRAVVWTVLPGEKVLVIPTGMNSNCFKLPKIFVMARRILKIILRI